jgi:predicted transposase YdaD
LNAITQANTESIQEAMEMRKKLTLEQVIENTGLGAKWEARGRTEGHAKEKLEIARKMKKMGDSVERIHTITSLSPEAIQKL